MPETTVHAPGTFCWIELAAREGEVAKRFYSGLFGWTYEDSRYGPGENDVYTMYGLNGQTVAASYQSTGSERSAWLSYVAVENADASAARARELGGTVPQEALDVMDAGRTARVQDPGGAVLALWQARRNPGVGVRGEPNSLVWNELMTHDATRAAEFYTGLFGWRADTQDYGEQKYTTFTPPSGPGAGGMFELAGEMAEMSAAWVPYFRVADADDAARRAAELGATVAKGPADIPGVGRFAFIIDPQGAQFYILQVLPGM